MKNQFKRELKKAIKDCGYWSSEVYIINNLYQDKVGYNKWLKWHNEVKLEF